MEPTFTSDEVRELLSGLSGAVKADVESELISTSHTNVLLLRQVFAQAEKYHLKLQVNISELENRYVVGGASLVPSPSGLGVNWASLIPSPAFVSQSQP